MESAAAGRGQVRVGSKWTSAAIRIGTGSQMNGQRPGLVTTSRSGVERTRRYELAGASGGTPRHGRAKGHRSCASTGASHFRSAAATTPLRTSVCSMVWWYSKRSAQAGDRALCTVSQERHAPAADPELVHLRSLSQISQRLRVEDATGGRRLAGTVRAGCRQCACNGMNACRLALHVRCFARRALQMRAVHNNALIVNSARQSERCSS